MSAVRVQEPVESSGGWGCISSCRRTRTDRRWRCIFRFQRGKSWIFIQTSNLCWRFLVDCNFFFFLSLNSILCMLYRLLVTIIYCSLLTNTGSFDKRNPKVGLRRSEDSWSCQRGQWWLWWHRGVEWSGFSEFRWRLGAPQEVYTVQWFSKEGWSDRKPGRRSVPFTCQTQTSLWRMWCVLCSTQTTHLWTQNETFLLQHMWPEISHRVRFKCSPQDPQRKLFIPLQILWSYGKNQGG